MEDVLAAFRDFGAVRPISSTGFHFDWAPVLASFAGETGIAGEVAIESTLTLQEDFWRWELDSNAFTTGRVLWRVANALRLFALVSLLTEKGIFIGWSVSYEGTTLATQDAMGGTAAVVVTERLAELVAGDFGKAVFLLVPHKDLEDGLRRQDDATMASERRAALISVFLRDQLSLRPPISEDEINRLKRQLGLPDGSST